jgi:hypothetical protein
VKREYWSDGLRVLALLQHTMTPILQLLLRRADLAEIN